MSLVQLATKEINKENQDSYEMLESLSENTGDIRSHLALSESHSQYIGGGGLEKLLELTDRNIKLIGDIEDKMKSINEWSNAILSQD